MTDTFRANQRALSIAEIDLIKAIKDAAFTLEVCINTAPISRERSLAMTKLEEAVMWSVKGITT